MIHGHEDILVGAVSVALGLFIGLAAACNWHWYYTLRSARFLEKRLGRAGARCVHGVLALGLIGLGIAVGTGFRLPVFGR